MPNTLEQQAVIDFIRDYPSLHLWVDARAGTGKTTTIVEAAQGINGPALAVAFNKKIATELTDRLPSNVLAKTMNGVGHGAWWAKIRVNLQVDADKMFRLTKKYFETADPQIPDPDGVIFTSVLGLVRWAKGAGLVPSGVGTYPTGLTPDHEDSWADAAFDKGLDWMPEMLPMCRRIMHNSIKEANSGIIDFDDQIYMSALFGGVFKRYPTVIVDESQDLSPLNHIMLTKMVGDRLIMVGDPFQAIYGFRGADSNSMTSLADMFGRSKLSKEDQGLQMERLPLTYSFRCPHVVAKRQVAHVSDFKSHEVCKEGKVLQWPRDAQEKLEDQHPNSWTIHNIPAKGAILCRNNAPLMKLAFALIAARRPVTILGRDIGASLATLLTKIVGKANLNTSVQTSIVLVDQWAKKEIEKLGNKESKKEAIYDRQECLTVLLESSGGENAGDCVQFIKDLFTDRTDQLTLASGHRSKGLEWDWVMHLDPWRVPSKFARSAAEFGNTTPMQQELNLKYVIETRTKDVLVLANLKECEELQEDRVGVEAAPTFGGVR